MSDGRSKPHPCKKKNTYKSCDSLIGRFLY